MDLARTECSVCVYYRCKLGQKSVQKCLSPSSAKTRGQATDMFALEAWKAIGTLLVEACASVVAFDMPAVAGVGLTLLLFVVASVIYLPSTQ